AGRLPSRGKPPHIKHHTRSSNKETRAMRKIMMAAAAAGLAMLLTCTPAHAWGYVHRGYTGYNPSTGLHHYGETAAVGPYGAGYRTSSYSPYRGYNSYSYGRSYSP